MAKDNNNINTDDLTDGGPSSSTSGTVASSTTGTKATIATTATSEPGDNVSVPVEPSPPAPADPPTRREENPFSFKHFLKWDGPAAGGTHYNHTINGVSSTGIGLGASGATSTSSSSSINHSRSTSNINGHGSSSTLEAANSNGTNGSSNAVIALGNPVNPATTITTSTGSPSKSATTSSLNVVSSTTGARPKIPQFQSVNTLSSESKMKRSPRFPSFDSQSSLSDFADERFGSIYQSRSNSSFSSDYPPGVGGSGAGLGSGLRGTHSSNGGEDAELLRGYVPRSYSNYDLDSPGSAAGTDRRHEQKNDGGNGGRLVGATEFSAALPDFVQDHLVMEQWYNTLPKGGSGGGGAGIPSGGGGSGSSGSVDFDDMFELAGVGSSGVIINDMPFDLTASSTGSGHVRGRGSDMGHRNSPTIPLDLPPMGGGVGPEIGLDLPHRRVTPTPSSAELPPDLTEGNAGAGLGDGGLGGARSRPYYYSVSPPPPEASSGSSAGTADKIHRLPDFLSDGPIHSSGRLADVTQDTPHGSETAAASAAASNHRHRLQQRQREAQYQNRLDSELAENERLRRELDQSRQTVSVQARRIRELERDLESMVSSRVTAAAAAAAAAACGSSSGNGGSTQSNANSFMQAKTRAASAEAEVKKLRQKIHSMSVEMDTLRRENETLKEEVCGGAIGGSSAGAGASAGVSRGDDGTNVNQRPRRERSSAFLRAHTIALRQAASSAENNLRQLLSGVENLRTMANQIETFGAAQTEELGAATAIPLEDYLHGVDINSEDDDDDDDDDDALGPAL